MAIPYSTARWVTILSFVIDIGAQIYGITATPSMLDVHLANQSFFTPHQYFVAGLFSLQQLAQLAWLYRFARQDKPNSSTSASRRTGDDRSQGDVMLDYAPFFAVGNIAIAAWMICWNNSMLRLSNVCVLVSGVANLYYMYARLPPMNTRSRASVLTNVVCRITAGINTLDILHNTSIAYFVDEPASTLVKVGTAVGFAVLGLTSDWIFGGCLVADLVALAFGQGGSWRTLLGGYAVGTAAIVGAKNKTVSDRHERVPAGRGKRRE